MRQSPEDYAKHYSLSSDEYLSRLDIQSLVPEAKQALLLELSRRNLPLEPPPPKPPSPPTPQPQATSDSGAGAGILILLCIMVGVGYGCYKTLDNAGWVPHTRTVNLYMRGDWLDGENRVCAGIQSPGDATSEPEIASLFCPEDYSDSSASPHNLPVRFWGQVSRPNVTPNDRVWGRTLEWTCTRQNDGFTCRSVN